MAESSCASHASELRFCKMYGQHWEATIGKLLCSRAPDGSVEEIGEVARVSFTNLGGPFIVRVRFCDGANREYPFGPSSPLFAMRENVSQQLSAFSFAQ